MLAIQLHHHKGLKLITAEKLLVWRPHRATCIHWMSAGEGWGETALEFQNGQELAPRILKWLLFKHIRKLRREISKWYMRHVAAENRREVSEWLAPLLSRKGVGWGDDWQATDARQKNNYNGRVLILLFLSLSLSLSLSLISALSHFISASTCAKWCQKIVGNRGKLGLWRLNFAPSITSSVFHKLAF